MTIYVYEDAETGRDVPPPDSVMELLREHKRVYVFDTEQGSVLLRRMPLRMQRLLDNIRQAEFPEEARIHARLRDIRSGIDGLDDDQIPEEIVKEIGDLYIKLKPIQDYSALGVIIAPRIWCIDDYYDLYAKLSEEEQDKLEILIAELSSVNGLENVDDTAMNIAEKHNVPLIDMELIDCMTIRQAEFLARRIRREQDDIERMMARYSR